MEGDHKLCFNNKMSTWSDKTVWFEVSTKITPYIKSRYKATENLHFCKSDCKIYFLKALFETQLLENTYFLELHCQTLTF